MKLFFQFLLCLFLVTAQHTNAQELTRFENKKGLYGFKDASGKTVIPAKFRHADEFSEDLALARNTKGRTGYIDTKGKEAVPFKYYAGTPFGGGVAGVIEMVKDAFKFKIIDKEGKEVVPPKYDGLKNYSEGFIGFNVGGKLVLFKGTGMTNGGKWGFIDTKGVEVIPPIYDAIFNFSEGLAPVNVGGKGLLGKGGKWGFINTKGEEIIPPQFDMILNGFKDGKAKVMSDNREFYIDTSGTEIQ